MYILNLIFGKFNSNSDDSYVPGNIFDVHILGCFFKYLPIVLIRYFLLFESYFTVVIYYQKVLLGNVLKTNINFQSLIFK